MKNAGPDSGTEPPGRGVSGGPTRAWLCWLQQVPALIYFAAGAFLLYLYWKRLNRQSVLACGVLFVLYSLYRFFLVRRGLRRSGYKN